MELQKKSELMNMKFSYSKAQNYSLDIIIKSLKQFWDKLGMGNTSNPLVDRKIDLYGQ